MLKFKFCQVCPVYQVRVSSFSFGMTAVRGHSPLPSTARAESRHSMSNFVDEVDPELTNLSSSKDKEILSYKKTIETLTEELDSLRSRVRELEQAKLESQVVLEQAKTMNQIMLEQASQGSAAGVFVAGREKDSLYSSGLSTDSIQLDELVKEVEMERAEKERYLQLLEEEKEQLQKEVKEKEKITSRLDSKVSDLTQTREKIAILEVEKDDYLQKLQRTVKELKHSKIEVREQVSLKRTLKAKLSTLEVQLRDAQGSKTPPEEMEASVEVSELQEKVRSSEKELEEFSASFKELAIEKQQLTCQLDQSLRAEDALVGETKELRRKLDTALHLYAATEDRFKQENETTPPVSVDLVDIGTQTDSPSNHNSQTQVDFSSELVEQAVQVDTLTDTCTQYMLHAQESGRQVLSVREEMKRNNRAFQRKMNDAEAKIRQLLDIKEQLTKKNDDMKKKINESKPPDYEVTLNSALHNIQELQQSLLGGNESLSTSDRLQNALAEMEKMKRLHVNEKLAMRQRLSDAIVKVKEREIQNTEEINNLQAKLEKAQKQLQEASNAATRSVVGVSIPESSIVSFMEVEAVSPYKLDEGTWGSMAEAIFRGSRVAVRCVPKESLALNPIQTIHRQINSMAHTRHPNLALFIAVAMDAPSGMMILTEPLTCSLRQAYQSDLIKPDKLPVLLDVALALNFLHLEKRPIVHGNLSSHCVLVEEGAEGQWRAKLSDIGVTTSIMMLSGPAKREATYLPPELDTNNPLTSPSLDVYSYGVLMCELATSRLPGSARDVAGQVSGLKDSRLPQIACLVQCCMAGDPSQRPVMGNMVKKISNLVANKIQVP